MYAVLVVFLEHIVLVLKNIQMEEMAELQRSVPCLQQTEGKADIVMPQEATAEMEELVAVEVRKVKEAMEVPTAEAVAAEAETASTAPEEMVVPTEAAEAPENIQQMLVFKELVENLVEMEER